MSLCSIFLVACAGKPKLGENLVVMKLTIPSYSTVKIRNINTNESKSVKLKYLNGAFFVSYLPAGVYEFSNFAPFKDVNLHTQGSIKFVVADNCSNYLGQLNLLGNYFHSNGKPTEVSWEFNEEQQLHSWIVGKMEGSSVCIPHNKSDGKLTWDEFERKYLG